MSIHLFKTWGRKLGWLGLLALGLAQVGCAHPVVMEPQVVISSRFGYPPVYAQVPGPVVVMPPPVVYALPVYRTAPAWAYGGYRDERDWRHRHGHPYGHGRGHGRGDEREGWHR